MNQDDERIGSLGPYAMCLSYILGNAQQRERKNIKFVYRGVVMTEQ